MKPGPWQIPLIFALTLTACGHTPTTTPPATPTPTPTPAPATLADLSAEVISGEAGQTLNCRDDVHARITLTNNAASPVLVTGVFKVGSVLAGRCFSGADITYPITRTIAPKTTGSVMDRPLYSGGSGCCSGRCTGGTCEFMETFQVVTELGAVPAGRFSYKVEFFNCLGCGASTSAGPPRQ
jgi:hypothetical protein